MLAKVPKAQFGGMGGPERFPSPPPLAIFWARAMQPHVKMGPLVTITLTARRQELVVDRLPKVQIFRVRTSAICALLPSYLLTKKTS